MLLKKSEVNEENYTVFEVEADAAEFDAALNKAYGKNRGQINIPGFRKGKAPRRIIEGMYGQDVFYQDALDEIAPQAFEFGVSEGKLKFIGRPSIENVSVNEDKTASFSFKVQNYPIVTLGEYKGLKAPKPAVEISEEAVTEEVDKIRKYYEDRRQKDKGFIVRTYVSSVKAIPQCTIFWYEEHSLLGDDYNLMTLAFNKSTGEPMTSKEALDSLEIDGIILSTNVGKLFRQMHPLLELKETEMQGFETDESGTVTCVFMKLVAQKIPDETEASESTPEEEIHFYYYDLSRESLGLISDLGYEIP